MNLSPEAIAFLAGKGMSMADLAEFVRLAEKRKDNTATERQQRSRAKKRVNVTRDSHGVTPLIEEIITPPDISPDGENQEQRARKPHRLPSDWHPKPLPADLAAVVAPWPSGAIEREMAKFRDWAKSAAGKAGLKSDWDATWRNWLRRRDDEGTYRNAPRNQDFRSSHGNGADRRNSLARACDEALDFLG